MYLILIFLITIVNIFSEKFCINCKHFVKSTLCNDVFARCKLFPLEDNNKIDYLVVGKKLIDYKFCTTVRNRDDLCGLKGKYFDKKITFPNFYNPCYYNEDN